MGSTTSLNGVPPALLLAGRRVGAQAMVADLALFFVVGNGITLVILFVGGRLPLDTIAILLAWWVPVGLLGSWIGVSLSGYLPQRFFYWLAITLIVGSAVLSLAQGLM